MTDFIPSGYIKSVEFSVSGTETIREDSNVTVTSHELFKGGDPQKFGLYDAKLGTTDIYRCQTCQNTKKNCLGHPGEIRLNYPIINAIALEDILKWLKVICHKCGELVITDDRFQNIPRKQRLSKIPNDTRGKNRICVKCEAVHPVVRRDENMAFLFIAEVYGEEGTDVSYLYPHHIYPILDRIRPEVVESLGKKPNSHPRHFILWSLQVPAVTIRPDVRKQSSGQNNSDDITILLQDIVKKNNIMPNPIPQNLGEKLQQVALLLSEQYYKIVRDSGEKSVNSIANRIKGKKGLFRKNQMGKRVHSMCRSTITGDSTIPIDAVGIPLVFAQRIQLEDVVQHYNRAQMHTLIRNHRQYPGATKIRKRLTGVEYDIDPDREIQIEIGDTIIRDVLDGDFVGFNRQPSLAMSNIGMHKVIVTRDPNILTLRMNVIACSLYNADFDGDQMNLIFATNPSARNELAEMSKVPNWLISHTTSGPVIGQVDDSVVGSMLMTHDDVVLNKYHAMLLFQNTTLLPSFAEVGPQGISGRDCFSKILQRTPINFKRQTQYYNSDIAPWMNYSPRDIEVNIQSGRLLTGVLDKKSIGKGAKGGIYHLIANEYSPEAALDVMFNTQQLAIGYTMHAGFTIGIRDMRLAREAKPLVDKIAGDMVTKSQVITDRLNNGELIPPIGMTVEKYYEQLQINALSVFDDFHDIVMANIDAPKNNLMKLINSGSKGKNAQLFAMVSCGGQKIINGERITERFGFRRTLPFFRRFDTDPEARGYIINPYFSGMTSTEYTFNAMASRFDLISKALTTASTGYQTRKSVLSLQGMHTNNFLQTRKGVKLSQFLYGEDGLDARKLERVSFPTAMCSDSELKKYLHDDFPAHNDRIQSDRQTYRKYYMQLEGLSPRDSLSDTRSVAVNVEQIIRDVCVEYEDMLAPPSAKELGVLMTSIEKFIEELPFVFSNMQFKRIGGRMHEVYHAAVWLMQMQMRAVLCPKRLVSEGLIQPVLEIILQRVYVRYGRAIAASGMAVGVIAALCFSEPLTQYMLDAHHRSASGGTSTNVIGLVTDVLAAKKTKDLVGPEMYIECTDFTDENEVRRIGNSIEVMRLQQFVQSWQIFFEKFMEPQHSDYVGETAQIGNFVSQNPLLRVPSDLVNWCIRFKLNKTQMILKNMSIELMINKLRFNYPQCYFVYPPENDKNIYIRVYPRQVMFKKSTLGLSSVNAIRLQLLDVICRGVEGILNTRIIKKMKTQLQPDGSLKHISGWNIQTEGTNLTGVLRTPGVDGLSTHTNAIPEICEVLGIEAARQKIIVGMRAIVQTDYRHYLCYADDMTYQGKISSVELGGLRKRDPNSVLLRIGFGHPFSTIKEAALNSMEDNASGIAQFLIGSVPKIGTLYNSVSLNESFVQKNVQRPDDLIQEMLL